MKPQKTPPNQKWTGSATIPTRESQNGYQGLNAAMSMYLRGILQPPSISNSVFLCHPETGTRESNQLQAQRKLLLQQFQGNFGSHP